MMKEVLVDTCTLEKFSYNNYDGIDDLVKLFDSLNYHPNILKYIFDQEVLKNIEKTKIVQNNFKIIDIYEYYKSDIEKQRLYENIKQLHDNLKTYDSNVKDLLNLDINNIYKFHISGSSFADILNILLAYKLGYEIIVSEDKHLNILKRLLLDLFIEEENIINIYNLSHIFDKIKQKENSAIIDKELKRIIKLVNSV